MTMTPEQAQGARVHVVHYLTLWLDNTYDTCKWIERMVERVKDHHTGCDVDNCDIADVIGEKIKNYVTEAVDLLKQHDASPECWVSGLLMDILDLGDTQQWRMIGKRYVE